jgi:tellurite resistance-related uncharacterized protein
MTNEQLFSFKLVIEGHDMTVDETWGALVELNGDVHVAYVAEEHSAIFDREAPSYEEAVASAVREVESLDERLKVVRVDREEEDEEPVTERAPWRPWRRGFRALRRGA